MLESRCDDNKCRTIKCKKSRPYCCWKQVEINTIASGFGYLGPISKEIQRLFKIYSITIKQTNKKSTNYRDESLMDNNKTTELSAFAPNINTKTNNVA